MYAYELGASDAIRFIHRELCYAYEDGFAEGFAKGYAVAMSHLKQNSKNFSESVE